MEADIGAGGPQRRQEAGEHDLVAEPLFADDHQPLAGQVLAVVDPRAEDED